MERSPSLVQLGPLLPALPLACPKQSPGSRAWPSRPYPPTPTPHRRRKRLGLATSDDPRSKASPTRRRCLALLDPRRRLHRRTAAVTAPTLLLPHDIVSSFRIHPFSSPFPPALGPRPSPGARQCSPLSTPSQRTVHGVKMAQRYQPLPPSDVSQLDHASEARRAASPSLDGGPDSCVGVEPSDPLLGNKPLDDDHLLLIRGQGDGRSPLRADWQDTVILALKSLAAGLAAVLVVYSACYLYNGGSHGSGDSASGWGLMAWVESLHRHHHPHHAAQAAIDVDGFVFGLGTGDVTGPIVEVNMMGYASMPQTNTGLHIRLRSRAFTVGSRSTQLDRRVSAGRFRQQLVATADGSPDRWIFINSDICMGDTAVRRGVVDRLRELYPGLYGERNIAFVGTHSHAGPGGFIAALLPTLTSKGVVRQNVDAIVDGTVLAAVRSHEDFERRLREGKRARLSFGRKRLAEAHIQRSRWAYEQNPQEERDRYGDDDLDHDFSLLRFEELTAEPDGSGDGGGDGEEEVRAEAKGFLSWYAVHGTSLYENNTLTSADNKGLAALLYETAEQPDRMPGQATFVAGFSQSTVGDTSPNTLGAWCDDGSVCEWKHSTCDNGHGKDRVQTCHGRGPAWGDASLLDVSPTGSWDFASNEIIARLQVEAARDIMARSVEAVAATAGGSGNGGLSESESESDADRLYRTMVPIDDRGGARVRSVKINVDMSRYTVYRKDGSRVKTCPAALGYGFAGGTTDGPGAFDFVQGSNSTDHHNPLWDVVKAFIKSPTKEQVECQAPKSVLLDIGEIHKPYDWGPSIVEVQILQVGQLFILIVPGEFTTMAGRRLKAAVAASIRDAGLLADGVEPIVQISGPASTYGHYITTEEEYSVQRYEGASTLFGPHTLEAYLDLYAARLVPALKEGARDLPQGPWKEVDLARSYQFKTGVVYDNPPLGHRFGDVLTQPLLSYPIPAASARGSNASLAILDDGPARSAASNVTAVFVAANPRNNLRLEGTYFEVQRYADHGEWTTVRTDGHHSTTLRWKRTNGLTGSSTAEVAWSIESWTEPGLYRIVYNGDRKVPFTGKVSEFQAVSSEFYVV
ncbi:hypothetical protein ACQY0O_004161 [Thecaphora frezii]